MENLNFYVVLIVVTLFTILFRTLPITLSLPEKNENINIFFEFMPISILTILALPEVFTSVGVGNNDIFITTIITIYVIVLSYKKFNLAFSVFSSVFLVVVLKELVRYGIF